MLSLLERSRCSVCCRGVSSVICSTTSLDQLALCVYIYIYLKTDTNPPNQPQNKNKKTFAYPPPLHLPSRFFSETSINFALLTWPLSRFQTTLLKSVLLCSPLSCFCSYYLDSCFLASFPLLCFLPFFLVCSTFAFSETHKKETSGSFNKNYTCGTDHHISVYIPCIICHDTALFIARTLSASPAIVGLFFQCILSGGNTGFSSVTDFS